MNYIFRIFNFSLQFIYNIHTMIEILKEKRLSFRQEIRRDQINNLIKKIRLQLQETKSTNYQTNNNISTKQLFIQCQKNNEQAFKWLGNSLIESNLLLQEAFNNMKHYVKSKNYSWVVLIIIKKLNDLQLFTNLIQYYHIVDRFIEQEDLQIVENGLKSIFIMFPTVTVQILSFKNFLAIVKQLIFSSNKKIQLLSFSILVKSFENQEVKKYLLNEEIIDILKDLLNSNQMQQQIILMIKDILLSVEYQNKILEDEQLRNLLITKVYVGKQSIKHKLLEMWKDVIEQLNTYHLKILFEEGILDIFLEGFKLEISQISYICNQAINKFLEKVSDDPFVQFSDYLKYLEDRNLPEILLNLYYSNQKQGEIYLQIIQKFFDHYLIEQRMINK